MAAAIDNGVGLERLCYLAKLKIHQKAQWGGNKYMVNTVDGDVLFTMKEKSGVLSCLLRDHTRNFNMEAVDSQGRMAFMMHRTNVCFSDQLEVTVGGQVVCIVRKECTFMTPLFSIDDDNDVPVLRVKGDCHHYKFQLQTQRKTAIGSISKKFRGLLEMLSYVNDYEITFPADLELRYKVATIASCILIDYRYRRYRGYWLTDGSDTLLCPYT